MFPKINVKFCFLSGLLGSLLLYSPAFAFNGCEDETFFGLCFLVIFLSFIVTAFILISESTKKKVKIIGIIINTILAIAGLLGFGFLTFSACPHYSINWGEPILKFIDIIL